MVGQMLNQLRLDCSHLIELVELVELHRHWHYLAVSHVLEQDLRVGDDQRVGDVQGVSCHLVIDLHAVLGSGVDLVVRHEVAHLEGGHLVLVVQLLL